MYERELRARNARDCTSPCSSMLITLIRITAGYNSIKKFLSFLFFFFFFLSRSSEGGQKGITVSKRLVRNARFSFLIELNYDETLTNAAFSRKERRENGGGETKLIGA